MHQLRVEHSRCLATDVCNTDVRVAVAPRTDSCLMTRPLPRRGDFCVDSTLASSENRPVFLIAPAAVSALRGTRANASSPRAFARRRIYRTTVARRARALFESARNVCMADVCPTAPAVLSPLSPNESRKRRHARAASKGRVQATQDRPRVARRLLHLRGFSIDVRQAEELARFIDQFPPEIEGATARDSPVPRGIRTDPAPACRPPTPFSAIAPLTFRAATASPPSGRIPHPGEVR